MRTRNGWAPMLGAITALLLVSGCSKSTTTPPPSSKSMDVVVVDQSQMPVAGASVMANTATGTTNSSGSVSLAMASDTVQITATADGYTRTIRSVVLPSDNRSVLITLLRTDLNVVTVHAATGDTVRSSDGIVRLILPAGALDADAQVSVTNLVRAQLDALPMRPPDSIGPGGTHYGWMAGGVVAWSIQGARLRNGQTMSFRVPNPDTINFPRGSTGYVQMYYAEAERQWHRVSGGSVSADGAWLDWSHTGGATKVHWPSDYAGWCGIWRPLRLNAQANVCVYWPTGETDSTHGPMWQALNGAYAQVDGQIQMVDANGCASFMVPKPDIGYGGSIRGTGWKAGFVPIPAEGWGEYLPDLSLYRQIVLHVRPSTGGGGTGTIMVRVNSALTGVPVVNAAVTLIGMGLATVYSDSTGTATLGGLPTAAYNLMITHPDYQSASIRAVAVTGGQTTTVGVSLSTPLTIGQYRFVLSWGTTPRDLDMHMRVPPDAADPSGFEIAYYSLGNADAYPFTRLDHDITSGYGPETITLHQVLSGTYKLFIHQYSTDAPIQNCGAQLQVFNRSGLQTTLYCPSGDATSRYWYVLDFDGASSQITYHNVIQPSAPTAGGLKLEAAYPPKTATPQETFSVGPR